jgi:hypothetical protein
MPQGKLLVANHTLNQENLLADVQGLGNYVLYVNLNEMQSGDTVNIRGEMQVNTTGNKYDFVNETISFGDFTDPVQATMPVNVELNQHVCFYITQTAGVKRNFEWRAAKL